MLEFRCPFCHSLIRSEFYDDIESHAMACRETTLPQNRGSLAEWKEHNNPESCSGEQQRTLAYTEGMREG